MANQSNSDQIVREYLRDLTAALRSVPASTRREFVDEITQHIEQSRLELGTDDSIAIQRVLDRLGTPGELASELLASEPTTQIRDLDKATPWLLALGGIFAGIGWLFGLYGLWTSKVWRIPDRILGSLIWPIFVASFFWAKANSDGAVCSGGTPLGVGNARKLNTFDGEK